MKKLAKKAKEENEENPEAEGLVKSDIESFKDLQDYLNQDPYKKEEKSEALMNYKLINNCVKFSSFKSQSLEKLYCHYVTYNIEESDFILKNKKFNQLLGQIFWKNSQKYMEAFINLQPSYITEESEYND